MSTLCLFLFAVFLEITYSDSYIKYVDCNHYYDKPIDVCFSANSSLKGLVSYKYSCSLFNTSDAYSITLDTFNNTANCDHKRYINSTILYNLTTDDINATTGSSLNPFVSCGGYKSCPYFKGRYYLTKILTDTPTADPTVSPSIEGTPLVTPQDLPTTTSDSINYTTTDKMNFYLSNETCARSPEDDYYQEVVYVIDMCLPYQPIATDNTSTNASNTLTNDTFYTSNQCTEDAYGTPLSITNAFYPNDTCNNSMIEDTLNTMYADGECYNYTLSDETEDINYILFDSETDYLKLSILECNYLVDGPSYPAEYLFYEFDLIFSWIVWITASLMLVVYTLYILDACRTVNQKQQYKETGVMVLDDDFSESRLAVIVFQWFTLFSLWLNSSFGLVNHWSYIEMDDVDHCNLMMSALDLSWHWGKGFLYLSLMCRIVLIMDGLSDAYEIPKKILKLFAFEIVAYFMLTPVLDLVTTRADHRLHKFVDERADHVLYVCGEVIEYWISFLLFFGDLLLCSTTIGVYLYALGELVMNPIRNQKLIDMLIRYAIFSIFAAIWIQIGNGLWATNNFSIARYVDTLFIVLSIMFTLTICTGCYTTCCSTCHKRMRRSYITSFMTFKQKLMTKEMNEIKNNPKYVLKSYDKSFDSKLSAILSRSNLRANKSMDRYRQNVALHHIHSTVKSKKKLRKLQKKVQRSMRSLGDEAQVKLDDRDLTTIQHLVTFKTNKKFIKRGEDESSCATMTDQLSTASIGSGTTKQRIMHNHGLLAHLDPTESTLPTALTIAIHSSVVETSKYVQTDDDRISQQVKETIKYKVHKKMEDIWTKVDTYYDENSILFCRRSPTIFPGIAYKLSQAERFALKERRDVIEGAEFSKSEDHSVSYDSEDENEFQKERLWPNASRKYGQSKSLEDIYQMVSVLDEKQLNTIWDYIDKDRKKRIDYRATLVKLLGAFFLLYFKTHQTQEYVKIHEQAPRFDELEPLLVVLAKYIRDALRKRGRKCLKKSDYHRNFVAKYFNDAIDKRNKTLSNRNTKLQSMSPTSQMLSGGGATMPTMTPLASNELQLDTKEEEEDDLNSDELAFLDGRKSKVKAMFNDGEEARREIAQRISNYTPRESLNKYGYRDSEDAMERKLKIDKDMETLQQKRISAADNPMSGVNMEMVFTPQSEINVDDILKQTPTEEESSHFDVNALVAGLGSKHMLLTPTDDLPPQTQLTPDGTASMISMDMGMIDGLISDLVAIDEDDNDNDEKEHETQATEIINVDVVTPKRNKVMVIDDALIKQETFQIDDELLNDMIDDIDAMHDDKEEEEEEQQHDPQQTEIINNLTVTHDVQVSSQDWQLDAQLMDDVLDVTFAVDDSDEDDAP